MGHSPSLLLCQPEASTPLSVNIFLKVLTGVLCLNVDHGGFGFVFLFCFKEALSFLWPVLHHHALTGSLYHHVLPYVELFCQ